MWDNIVAWFAYFLIIYGVISFLSMWILLGLRVRGRDKYPPPFQSYFERSQNDNITEEIPDCLEPVIIDPVLGLCRAEGEHSEAEREEVV